MHTAGPSGQDTRGAPESGRRFIPALIIATLYAGRIAIVAVFTYLLWSLSPERATAFVVLWSGVFFVDAIRKSRVIGGSLWTFDELVRITLVSATAYAFSSTMTGAVIFLVVAVLYLSGLWTAQAVQAKVLHPEDAGYDPKESALIREHAIFFLIPRQSVRFARTCYLISRSGLVWVPLLLLQGVMLWPVWIVLYFVAGALSHILDPAPLMRGALKDSPHDMALRDQVLTLERIIDRIVNRSARHDGQSR